jgi:hypothetical protein
MSLNDKILGVFREHKAYLAAPDLSYTTLFRPREQIDVSDGLLYGRTPNSMITVLTGTRCWRSQKRTKEILLIDSPMTPK